MPTLVITITDPTVIDAVRSRIAHPTFPLEVSVEGFTVRDVTYSLRNE
jgi:hypothetical protein